MTLPPTTPAPAPLTPEPAPPAPVSVPKTRRPRRNSERHARLNQLAEMGNLAAGLAHELKNPLSTLKLNLQLLQEDLAAVPGTEAAQHRAGNLWKVADRLTQTLEDFLR
ncbi:MAG: histidine kinase dimerization/phospho-acceptor domain-containing protein [Phycisphaerae bacterium]